NVPYNPAATYRLKCPFPGKIPYDCSALGVGLGLSPSGQGQGIGVALDPEELPISCNRPHESFRFNALHNGIVYCNKEIARKKSVRYKEHCAFHSHHEEHVTTTYDRTDDVIRPLSLWLPLSICVDFVDGEYTKSRRVP
uniref:Uncharacterized protein n=1 Tax=Anopheles atroparvus TaxID=41427 RepID=A0AAG5DBA3_ANOAO